MKEPNQDRTATNKYNYNGKKVYIGLDVHKNSYFLTAKSDGVILKQDRQTERNKCPKRRTRKAKRAYEGTRILYEKTTSSRVSNQELI